MFRRLHLVLVASLALAGCNLLDKGGATSDDASNPHYKQAQQDLDGGNPSAAAADYEAALAENSKLAEANYELGVLYGDKLNDPVSSIYHYKRYLELAPTSDKAEQIKEQIDKQGQAFAASLPNASAAGGDMAKLQADNADLKQQVADATHTISKLQSQLAESKRHFHPIMEGTPPAAPTTPPVTTLVDLSVPNAPAPGAAANGTGTPSPTPTSVAPAVPPRAVAVDTNAPDVNAAPPAMEPANAPPTGPSRSYTVVKGDSLWKIAHKMYPGDTKNGEDKIRDANKDALNGKFLKPGQVLVIPQ